MILVLAVLTLPFAAAAQTPGAYVIPSVPAPRDPLPRFTIAPRGAPLGAIGLSLPPIGLPSQDRVTERHHRFLGRPFYPWPTMVFYLPPSVEAAAPPAVPAAKPAEPPPMPGRVVLDIVPQTAEVFADGYYVGTSADFSLERGGGVLDAGTHRLDVTATGHEPIGVDLRVASGQLVTYRATLKALPPPAPIPPSTFYLIPGCYMGNIPPEDAHLPDTCDKNRATIWQR